MTEKVKIVITGFQKELVKTNINDFLINRYDLSGNLLIVGSFDFGYYHDVEIIFYDVTFIACPTSFTADKLRLATNQEIDRLRNITYENGGDGYVFCFEDTFSLTKFYIIAHNVEFNFEKVMYFDKELRIEGVALSKWAESKSK